MNTILIEINELLSLCDKIKSVFKDENINKITSSHITYASFRDKVKLFFTKYNLYGTKYETLMEPYYYPKFSVFGNVTNGKKILKNFRCLL